jgi:drug/metabolite transporter (DMT)-like permease
MFVPKDPNPLLAALLTLMASAFVAGTTLMAKMLGTDALGPPLNPLQISQGRFVFAFIAFAIAALVMRLRWTEVAWPTHTLRVAFGWGGVTLMFAAAAFIPLSDATAVSFLNPVIGMLLAIPLLGERVGPVRLGAAVIALLGAMILLRPTPEAFQPAALLALAAALSLGLEVIVIKRLTGREGPLQILLVNNVIGVGIASVAAVWVWIAPTPEQWLALIAIGLLMAAAQTCFINAISRADASFVGPFFYATLVFAALYDFAVFGVRPDAVSVIGTLIILCGAGLLMWREGRVRPSAGSPVGKIATPRD